MKRVKDWKGGEVKSEEEREASVAEKRWVRRSKTAIWWMSLWMWGMSDGVARRTREKSGWPVGVGFGSAVAAGVGAGGGAAAAAIGFCANVGLERVLVFTVLRFSI